ncbi:FG-GAP repeat protein [Dictyocaulus viviparus]|uniref:FG-GAP repeat protein n=1 Tax=Dictyocaulus viviparus TaxID=29172 RepID=A0A0D8XYY6_DICVI|nr:FG-GAP repeat protein [Dictyocaulus viviparus]
MCAPKYKYFFSKFEVIEPVGSCFYAEKGFTHTEEFAPCRQERELHITSEVIVDDEYNKLFCLAARHGRHRFGYGQCGFSAALPSNYKKDDERLIIIKVFIGAPGVWYWQGAIFSQNVRNVSDRPNTEYGGKEYDHDMMGYATASGDLDGDGIDDIVAGVPRGNDLTGKLVLYTSRLKMLINLTDPTSSQQGQYCGSSVAVTDLNKDGRDDIIMGCPFYTDYVTVKDVKTQERKPQYDVGKVVVFFQTAPGVFDQHSVIVGEDQWGRFGFSLAATGDLNQDGYNDFVVGAPYAGKNMGGAAFIVHGSKDGVRIKPTQKVINEFFFSISSTIQLIQLLSSSQSW